MRLRCRDRLRALGFVVRDQRAVQLYDTLLVGPLLISSGLLLPLITLPDRVSFITAGVIVMGWNIVNILLTDREGKNKKWEFDK